MTLGSNIEGLESAQVAAWIRRELKRHGVAPGQRHDNIYRWISMWYDDWRVVSMKFYPYDTDDLPDDVARFVEGALRRFSERYAAHLTRSTVEILTLMALDRELEYQESS